MILSQNHSKETLIIAEPEPLAELPAMDHRKFDMKKKKASMRSQAKKNEGEKTHVRKQNMIKKDGPYSNKDLLHHPVVVPEPEPIPQNGVDFNTANNNSLHVAQVKKLCKQPPPKFASCPREVREQIQS